MKLIIQLGQGADGLIFGMPLDEIAKIWGDADKIIANESNDGVICFYNCKHCKLKFSHLQSDKLYSIEDHSDNIVLLNVIVNDLKKTDIRSLLQFNGIGEVEYSDYDSFDSLFCQEIWTSFYFRFDKLFGVEFSPLKKHGDKWIWPNKLAAL